MKKFNEIFPSYNTWENEILKPIKEDFDNPIWLGSDKEQRLVFNLMNDHLGEFQHNLKSDKLFISKCKLIMIDKYPTKYNQDRNFNTLEWEKISNEFFRTLDESETIGEGVDRVAPVSGSTTFNSEIDDLPISQVQKNKLKQSMNATSINLMREWRASKNANFNNTFIEFLSYYTPFFVTINREQANGLNQGVCEFSNGYNVANVPYLGYDNQNAINETRNDINNLINDFNGAIDTKQDKLVAGNNITINGNVISSSGSGGGTIDAYTKAETNSLLDEKLFVDIFDQTINQFELALNEKATINYVDNEDTKIKSSIASKADKSYVDREITTLNNQKQDKLTAGTNITIKDNVISATGGSSDVSKEYVDNLDKENVKNNSYSTQTILGNLNLEGTTLFGNDTNLSIYSSSNDSVTLFTPRKPNGTINIYPSSGVINLLSTKSSIKNLKVINDDYDVVNKKYVDDAIANVNVDTTNLVDKVSDESIDGVKTFIKSPKGPEPRDNDDLATRRYVVNTIGSFKVDAYTKAESDSIVSNILNGTTPHTKLYVGDILIETKGSFGYFGNTSRNMVWRAAEHRFTNKQLKEVANPVDNTDATNKKYVDDRDSSLEQRIIAIEKILNIP